jgi:hypothetical protein
MWGFDHKIKKQAATARSQLPFLRCQFFDCRSDPQPRLRADVVAPVQYAVNRGCPHPCLTGNFFDRKAMCHLMRF